MNYTYLFKINVIGDVGVGKTAFYLNFLHGLTDYNKIGVSFATKSLQISNQIIKYILFDFASQESLKIITKSHYKGSIGMFLMYDITKRQTFQNLSKRMQQARKYISQECVLMIIGNKNDLINQRQVSQLQGKKFAEDNGLLFMEVCALDSKSIQKAVIVLTKQILNKNEGKINKYTHGIKIGNLTQEQNIVRKEKEIKQLSENGRKCAIF